MFVKDEEELLLFSSEFINQKEYWCEQLSGDIKRTGILPDGIIENGSRAKRATADMDIPHFISERIAKLSNNSDLSTCIILLTALKILIYRYTNNRDISVLSPVCKLNASEDTINDRILIRDYIEPNITVKELLLKIRATTLEGYENQDYPFDKLMEFLSHQPETETASPISDIAFFSGNIHEDVDIAGLESRLGFGFDMEEEHLEGRIVYDAGVYGETFIRRMAAHYTGLLEHALQDFNADFSEFSFLTDSEKQLLLVDFNDGGTGYRRDKTIAGLFEEQVEKTPGNTAVEYEGKQLTYLELNKMAGTIADLLRARDIGEKKIVGIMTERRPEMIAAMLGILKSGAAYLPIDPGQPGNRIEYILKDSGIQTLLTQDHLKENINFHGEVICIEAIDQWEQAPLPSGNRAADYSENMAYIIYTSGSTGVPKGVVIENGAICNTLLWRKAYYGFDEKDVILQLPSYTFDSSVEDIFTPLISGASIVLVRQQDISDPGYLEHLIKNSGITHFLIVPGFYKSLLGTIHTSLRNLNSVTVAGEGFSEKLVKEHFEILPGVKLFNEYGPTENSVCTTVYEFDKSRTEVLIGKPISNVSCFIVDDNLKLRPIGIPGELCLSGPGLASEYLNNPGLTGEKFVDNPFIPGKKMYRTGDLAKWCEDGNIKFLGRVDHQVKIRGYRIEPGEIEAHLTELDNISEALVLVKEIPGEMETGNKYLCAYLVSDTDISVTQLRRSLATRLPDYMIPAYFVRLEKMPLNANGKINRNALPDPGKSGLTTDSQYAAPVNAVEGKLVEIWQDVLGSSRIGINDNFFEIGGDSIRTIQVASRMSKEGYRLRMKDIFQNPTIAKLAAVLKKTERIALQSAVQGRVKLTPIQSWFFKNKLMENYHYNHSVMLYSADGFDEQAVRAVFSKLQQHHDALRMTFSREPNGEIIQTNGGEDYPFSLQVYDCVDASENTIELKANELQASINLESGPMMKLGVFHSEDGDRLLIVIHHLVIDGISWRILFEDIGTLFQQYEKSEPLELPLKTDSFKLWAEGLSRYACNDSFLKKEAYHPLPSGRGIPVIPTDFDHNDNYVKDIESASFTLPTRETALLLTEVNEAFSTEIDDILLTALGLAIRGVSGTEELLIALEGHGRADILKDVDISRTVGWFTTICPFLLDFSYDEKINGSGNESLARQIKEIKESVRRLPNRGINYGIREYLTEAGSCEESVPAPRISFNYLGQFDSDVEKMPFSIAEESHGNTRSPNGKRGYELDVSGIIKNKKLKMTIDFNRNRYKKETIENLLEHFNRQLKRIISYCTTCGKKESTPSDLTYPHLSIEEFDTLQNQYLIDDIYPCTPLQEGIIFHSLVADASHGEPSVQISYRLQGELDEDAARRSLNMLINRYEVLRTAFIHEGVERHLQMVLKERRASFYYKDLRTAGSPGEKNAFIDSYRKIDRERAFDLNKDVLMRVSIIRLDEAEYDVTWNFHHIVMDGWCTEMVHADFFEIYKSIKENRSPDLAPAVPYRTYIEWLETRDKEESGRFWKAYLEGYEEMSTLCGQEPPATQKAEFQNEKLDFILDAETTTLLTQLATRNNDTLNTVIQSAWAVILGKYCRKHDVVFGAVVSGRPPGLEGVETMVGLFINTLPVRIRFEEDTPFADLLHSVRENAMESEPHHYYSLAEIQAESPLNGNLFDHGLVFENYPVSEKIDDIAPGNDNGGKLQFSGFEFLQQAVYDFVIVVVPGERLSMTIQYNENVYEKSFINRVAVHIKEVFAGVVRDEKMQIADIKISHDLLMARANPTQRKKSDFRF